MVEAIEGDMLTIDTHHPPKGKENRSILFLSLGEPSTNFPTPPTPKALKTNFCHKNLEPSLTPLNHALRVSEKVVHGMFKESLTSSTQVSKGHEEKRASKFKEELFAWLILFQPFNEERRGGNYLSWFEDKAFQQGEDDGVLSMPFDLKESNQLGNIIMLVKRWIIHSNFV